MKKILVISNFFFPENTPRAFRTTELVKHLCERGDCVTLILPNKSVFRNNPFELDNLLIVYSEGAARDGNNDVLPFSSPAKNSFTKHSWRLIKKVVTYFLPKELFLLYDRGLTNAICRLGGNFDGLISISHPLSVHLSSAIGLLKNRRLHCEKAIAEFSDPMFKGEYLKVFPLNLLVGFLFARVFTFFVVPVEAARKSFFIFKRADRIKVIPQGFDLSKRVICDYEPNGVTTFAYAGRFYRRLRNPEFFFKFLVGLKKDFIFKLYIPLTDVYVLELIEKYRHHIVGKIEILGMIPRSNLLVELSKADFLVNFDNEDSTMVPSKLIDYAISGRPILSFNSRTFSPATFNQFLDGVYSNSVKINLDDYDIRTVVNAYHRLL